MYTIECPLIFTSLLVLLMQFSNAFPVEMSVNKLMSNTQDKLDLVKYFNELKLNELCEYSILDDNKFKKLEPINPVPCLCTVIYNTTKELESSNISIFDVNTAKSKSKINDDLTAYNTWKNVTILSHSLKLLMDPLDNLTKWQMICHSGYSIFNRSVLCQFLNLEVILLNYSKQKQLNNTNTSENNLESPSAMVKPEKQNKPEDLPKTNSNEYPSHIDIQSLKSEVNNPIENKEEETDTYNNKDNENTSVDNPTENNINFELTSESKSKFKYSNDNSKDEYDVNISKTKESQSILSQNNAFSGPEETHFLFYFGIMTLLSMLFYLALYNKKKIIALVIEGRRSTNHRRRLNTASYTKVETDDGSTVF